MVAEKCNADVGPQSGRRRSDIGPTSLRHRSDIGPTSLRHIGPTSALHFSATIPSGVAERCGPEGVRPASGCTNGPPYSFLIHTCALHTSNNNTDNTTDWSQCGHMDSISPRDPAPVLQFALASCILLAP